MSTEFGAARFRRLLYGSIAVVSLLAAGLVAANLTQGPQLTSAQINVNTAVDRAGQRLLLTTNEQLNPVTPEQVTVSPAAAATATVNGSSIDLQFTGILSYNTSYTVSVADVASISAGATSTLSYTFTTANPTVYFLAPATSTTGADSGLSDAVLAAPVGGGEPKAVYSAPRIRQFVAFPDALVVDTVNDDGTDALTIVSLTGAAPVQVDLAGPGTVTGLKANPASKLFGYTFTPQPSPLYPTSPDQLYAYDITRGKDYTIPIVGTDYQVLTAKNWMFIPGTTSLVAQTPDDSLLLIDTLGEREGTSGASVIGKVDALEGFVPTTKSLVTTAGGAHTAIDFGQAGNPSGAFPLAGGAGASESAASGTAGTAIVDASGTALRIVDSGAGASTSVAKVAADGTSTALFSVTELGRSITGACVSPNGNYAVVATSDQQLSYVDLADGTVLSTVAGTSPNWCSAR
ncbi:hypothetical protein [Agreia sp. COWG]|uniref:hypothetical protein n=1 Tax=Agreia sp. COWG TaxID=2773266 RepID=UPI001927889E|nr:hypothetical protein [Agreia sp. COWG]CAD6011178.1 Big_5 domain-containing protein [Agreia sp. COWG]